MTTQGFNYKKWMWILFVINVVVGHGVFFTTIQWGLVFAGGIGLDIILYPILVIQFVLCFLAQEGRFLKGGLSLSVIMTILVCSFTLISLVYTLIFCHYFDFGVAP